MNKAKSMSLLLMLAMFDERCRNERRGEQWPVINVCCMHLTACLHMHAAEGKEESNTC